VKHFDTFSTGIDLTAAVAAGTAAVAAGAAMAAIQTLFEVLKPAMLQQHKLTLPTF
jgi:hypothetical protein